MAQPIHSAAHVWTAGCSQAPIAIIASRQLVILPASGRLDSTHHCAPDVIGSTRCATTAAECIGPHRLHMVCVRKTARCRHGVICMSEEDEEDRFALINDGL